MNVALALNSFSGRLQVESSAMRIEQNLAMASFGLSLSDGWFARVWVGGVLDGTLTNASHSGLTGPGYGSHVIEGGWIASAQISRQLVREHGWTPFVQSSFTVGWSQMDMTPAAGHANFGRRDGFLATDLRISVAAGWTFFELVAPYVRASAFAAPFYWHQGEGWFTSEPYRSGQDTDHFQVGAGATVLLPANVSAFVDFAALGESAITAGVSYSWATSGDLALPTAPAAR